MKTTLRVAIAVLTAFAIGSGIFDIAAPAMAQMQSGGNSATTPDMSMGMGGGNDMMSMMRGFMANHKLGMISSIQNDEQGQPGWIVAGQWLMEMGSTQGSNATTDTAGRISSVSGFHAILHMVRLNGSAMHTHEISNFTQTSDPTFDSSTNSTTITGTATITMREGPVPNVPMTIQIAQDKVIAITPDAATLENHFGNTPIYGIVVSPEMIQDMMQESMDGRMMNSSGGM
ncbi:MAG: hypothetical protein M3270_08100 [Thermoproteota archaeon]|nr:hypothetical protein [Thermoproteota archaeon]